MSRGVGDQGPRWGRAAAPPVASRVAQAHPVGPSSAAGTVISTRIFTVWRAHASFARP